MTQASTLEQLKADLTRWETGLPEAEGTYCQGIANKAFGVLELLLKQLLGSRLAAAGLALPGLLVAVGYNGNARSVEKLPPGTLVDVLLKLAESDDLLRRAITDEQRQALKDVVPARNKTTHEVLAPELRERTRLLLRLIVVIVSAPRFAALLDP